MVGTWNLGSWNGYWLYPVSFMVHDYHDWLYDKPGMFEIYVEIGCDDIYHQINHGYYWYCPHWLPLGLTPRGLKKSIDQQLWTKDADGDGALSRSSAARKQERNTSGSWRDWNPMASDLCVCDAWTLGGSIWSAFDVHWTLCSACHNFWELENCGLSSF